MALVQYDRLANSQFVDVLQSVSRVVKTLGKCIVETKWRQACSSPQPEPLLKAVLDAMTEAETCIELAEYLLSKVPELTSFPDK
jgi:hypothetical protein